MRRYLYNCLPFEPGIHLLPIGLIETVDLAGSIRSRKWEDRDGNERRSYDIVARQMQMLSSAANGNGAKPKGGKPAQSLQPSEEENPFGQDGATEEIPF